MNDLTGTLQTDATIGETFRILVREIETLKAQLNDWESGVKSALDEKCNLEEKHCTCVPALRMEIKKLEKEIKQMAPKLRETERLLEMSRGLRTNDKHDINKLKEALKIYIDMESWPQEEERCEGFWMTVAVSREQANAARKALNLPLK